jgi:chromate transporter
MRVRHQARRLAEIAVAFLRLGLIAFGGPAAHLALLENEFVSRRGWVSRQRFLDLMGATNLIPGPNSTEMTMHLGYERGGAAGLFAAGFGFVVPAAGITGVLAWFYLEFGTLPSVEPVMAGVRPAVLVIILGAVWKLGRKAISDWRLAVIAACVAAAVWSGLGEVPAILLGGVVGALCLQLPRAWNSSLCILVALSVSARTAAAAETAELGKLGLFFLKVGSVLYGSGYVLIAFLEGGLVDGYGWVTRQQLLDAIAVGQFTPGPVLTAATFLGFLVAGPKGAAVATVGIFLPAFGFVWMLNPLVRRLRKSPVTSSFLDAINASAVGLMGVVAVDLARATLTSWPAWAIAACAAAGLFAARWAAAWVVLAGGLLGWLAMIAGQL